MYDYINKVMHAMTVVISKFWKLCHSTVLIYGKLRTEIALNTCCTRIIMKLWQSLTKHLFPVSLYRIDSQAITRTTEEYYDVPL